MPSVKPEIIELHREFLRDSIVGRVFANYALERCHNKLLASVLIVKGLKELGVERLPGHPEVKLAKTAMFKALQKENK